jgi:hypothetical protein
MLYSYFYTLDAVLGEDEGHAQPMFDVQKFVQALGSTLWSMGETLWMVKDDE